MAVVSQDEYSRLVQMGWLPSTIERESRAWVDKVLSDPDLEMTLVTDPSASVQQQLAAVDPAYGTGGIYEALSAALDPGAVVADLKKAAEDMIAGVKPILQPTSWMIVAGLVVVALMLWKR